TEQVYTQEQYEKFRFDYNQLVEFSKCQHDKSLSYYDEYTCILSFYNDLNTKYTYLQCQNELNNHQNHYIIKRKKQSEEIDLLRSTLIQHDIKLQQFINNETKLLVKQLKLEHKIKLLEQNNIKLKSNREKSLRNQTAQLDDSNHAQNEFSTSEQSKQSLATELGTLKYKYAKLEVLNINLNNHLQYKMKCSKIYKIFLNNLNEIRKKKNEN
ncbi:unnamed protein product, partial [Rotaria sordida]